jgi:hypothetical protein
MGRSAGGGLAVRVSPIRSEFLLPFSDSECFHVLMIRPRRRRAASAALVRNTPHYLGTAAAQGEGHQTSPIAYAGAEKRA